MWHNHLSQKEESQIERQYSGKRYWLRQSLFSGPFYDDNRSRLTDVHSFETLDYLQTPDHDIILPPPSDGIVVANTIISIEKIEWPQGLQLITRPLFTPRYHPWVYFKISSNASPIQLREDKTHILVVPKDIQTADKFSRWFSSLFSNTDLGPWLATINPEVRKGIESKTAIKGMTFAELQAALGRADSLRTTDLGLNGGPKKELATFGKRSAILENGTVSKIVSLE